ncbi:MAG TPA: pyridine nucleotide-disulfide oxidoreductase [Gammaproteobacteria bacterium]|uniref:NAD(P)/FAD-dependent oxidoreductase n=1 Tax=Immundisolibacter sp. TaxID=1934948 RepID=UPI000E8894BC|nr:pyridine nucleotide-disulfide oxidoreductase [Gammaproteobacteria bacterium]HCZ48454.1 pyridine nucleotide-disulfide oxidoreductase [Gammaproteobacteria bacterium]MCH77892.1 pyridine nucleotide-disulfide oxidoreductase [Gammaproteobacteria bacterium]
MAETPHYDVLIIGGGAGGLAVASALARARPALRTAVVEPKDTHDYQPGWTLVGGGTMKAEQTRRPMARLMPTTWVRDAVAEFQPDANEVLLASGDRLRYDQLVVAAGLQLDWQRIEGLDDALGRDGVTSNYRGDLAPYTWQCVQNFSGGRALFTQPPMPIKCAGAPQKVLYLAADAWRRRGVPADVHFFNQGGAMFGVPLYARSLDGVMAGYGATPHFGHNLVAVDGARREATFERTDGSGRVTEHYDFLHVTPPQSAPDFIKSSPLADAAGWVEVDRNSLRHVRYDNVFALGDCAGTPNAKTAAAVRKQFPVLVANLLAARDGRAANAGYDGYGGCPLTVERGKVLLAEFCYDGKVVSTLPLDPTRSRRLYWWMKTALFPWMYWHVILRGRDWRHPAHTPHDG